MSLHESKTEIELAIQPGWEVGYSQCGGYYMIRIPLAKAKEANLSFPFAVALIVAHYGIETVARLLPVRTTETMFTAELKLDRLRPRFQRLPSRIECYEVTADNQPVLRMISFL